MNAKKIISSLQILKSPELLEMKSEEVIKSRFYSAQKDEEELSAIREQLGKRKGDLSALLLQLMEVSVRLHLYYLKVDTAKAEQLSSSLCAIINGILNIPDIGDGILKRERSNIEAMYRYWDSTSTRDLFVNSFEIEKELRQNVSQNVEQKDFDSALKNLTDILKIREGRRKPSETSETLREMAEVTKKKGDLAGALYYYAKATKNDPYSWFDVGVTLSDMGRFELAIKSYKKFLKKAPKDTAALNNIGLAYERLQQYAEALVYYDKALEIDNKYFLSLVGKGFVLLQQQRVSEAINYYEQALEIDPADQNTLINLTALYNDGLHDCQKAVYYAQKAYDVDPNQPSAASNLAESLIVAGRNGDGRQQATRAMEMPNASMSGRTAMHLVIAASHFLEGNQVQGDIALKNLKLHLTTLPQSFKNEWGYDGLTNCIRKSNIPEKDKAKLYRAIENINNPPATKRVNARKKTSHPPASSKRSNRQSQKPEPAS